MANYDYPKEFTNRPTINFYRDSECTIPSNPTKNSYAKFSWDFGTPGNNNSPIKGCRIYIFTKKVGDASWTDYGTLSGTYDFKYSNIWYFKKDSDGNTKNYTYTLTVNKTNYKVKIGHTNEKCYVVIPCSKFGIDKGDEIQFWIEPFHWHEYSLNKEVKDYWRINYHKNGDTTNNSIITKLGSIGVVFVKAPSSQWSEGQVYVKTNNGWKASSEIYVKTHGGWKKSI